MGKPPRTDPANQDAAAYVRMSTEHQRYSTANQMDVIREYAKRRELNIIATYSDGGKSGLNIEGRGALGQLIADVDNREAQFKHILVYDVSRWGRFQDADESAYYEYMCRRAGIAVHYCAEQFDNDGSPASTIFKSVKRAMAAEFSRELSAKVFQGACRLVQLGFRQGGKSGYGYRRMLVGENGQRKGILEAGEHKCIQTDHIILVPGPKSEVATVNWIFRQFVEKRCSEQEIATLLNKKCIFNHGGRRWNSGVIHELLTNEKYIGHNIYHRHSCKLKKKHVDNPPNMWVRAEDAFEGIVRKKMFEAAREIILQRKTPRTNDEVLKHLRRVLEKHGKLTGALIDRFGNGVGHGVFCRRFGSLAAAYALVGYRSPRDYSYKHRMRKLKGRYPVIIAEIRQRLEALGCVVRDAEVPRHLIVNEQVRISIVLCRHYATRAGVSRWVITADCRNLAEMVVAARLFPDGDSIRDYYMIPAAEIAQKRLWLAEENGADWDGYRFDTLEYLYSLFEQVTVKVFNEEAS